MKRTIKESNDVLEQARTKLLLSHVSLLERADAQECQFSTSRVVSTGTVARRRAARARRLARGGAYRKAIQVQMCLAAARTPDEESSWAAQLLPPSARPLGDRPALALPADPVDDLEEYFNPLKGVSFAAYFGAGPSGARPEHLQALLSCGRHRNRLLRALRLAESLAVSGQLPTTWRCSLDSRVVFIVKKGPTSVAPMNTTSCTGLC